MAEYEGVDALLAAITDAAPPEGARDDVVFMAEYRSAAADVDVLREQLVIIGDALADSGRQSESAHASSRKPRKPRKPQKSKRLQRFKKSGKDQQAQGARAPGGGRPGGVPKKRSRHPGGLAVGTLAAAAVATLVVGMGWLVAHDGGGADVTSSSDSKAADRPSAGSFSGPGYIACSRLIAEGEVTEVLPVPGTGQDRITLDVYHYYKPAKGEKTVTFLMDRNAGPRPHLGDEVLVGIRQHAVTPDIWTTGEKDIARDRSWIVRALPESQGMECGR
ncbi:hypothetical protein ACFYW8_07215 [Streptomyces sp. NPDC002742]|uniref:hypothetical protein n=1 Tax=Streptomyces sp. NPDC002742 TaxID=3364663 RepID=UPI0036BF5F03